MDRQWKTFVYEKDGKTLEVSYWAKDFSIKYRSRFYPMIIGRHMPYACPSVFTEEMLRSRCGGYLNDFLKAENFLVENQEKIRKETKRLAKELRRNEEIIEVFNVARRQYKKEFKENKFSQKEYQKKLKLIEDEKYELRKNSVEEAEAFAVKLGADDIETKRLATSYIMTLRSIEYKKEYI